MRMAPFTIRKPRFVALSSPPFRAAEYLFHVRSFDTPLDDVLILLFSIFHVTALATCHLRLR